MAGEVDFVVTDNISEDTATESIVLGHETLVHIRKKNKTINRSLLAS